jgi:hypothetical protein
MLEKPTATEPTVALTRDVLDRIEFGDLRLDGCDDHDRTAGGRINAAVPIMLDGRQIGTAKLGIWVCTSDASDADASDQVRQSGYAMARSRGTEQIEWAVDVAEGEDEAAPPIDQAEKQLLTAAHSEIDFEEALAAAAEEGSLPRRSGGG